MNRLFTNHEQTIDAGSAIVAVSRIPRTGPTVDDSTPSIRVSCPDFVLQQTQVSESVLSLKSIKLGAFAAVSAVAGTLIFAAVPASASTAASTANPPYDGCPGWALCLYENGGGLGSKLVLTPPPAGSGDQIVHLVGKHFLNGDSADNATSSWLNNSQCSVTFWDDPSGELHPSDVDYAPAWTWGRTADYSFGTPSAYRNDRISSLRFGCW